MSPHRPAYWEIEPTWLFYLFAAVAVGVFGYGMIRRLLVWRAGAGQLVLPAVGRGLVTILRDGALGARLFGGDIAGGVMHLAIMWGFVGLFVGTTMVAIDTYLVRYLTGSTYLVFSVAMELCGLALLAGIAWAVVRRYLQRLARLERGFGDFVPPMWLLAIGLSGFALEGARLAAQQPTWAAYSFAGAVMAPIWPMGDGALTSYRLLWWGHALASLGFVAYLPWSKMLHALLAPANLYLGANGAGEIVAADGESDARFGWRHLFFGDACVTCGRCVEVCPSHGAGEPLSPRACVRAARTSHTSDATLSAQGWYCTTCGACARACPIAISPMAVIGRSREALIEEGAEVPAQLAETLERLYKYQNPWLAKKGQRAAWQNATELPDLAKKGEAELLYFVGCTTALDTRAQGIARALTRIFESAGLAVGTLGKKEPCCGDIARRTGELGLFEEQRDKTTALLDKHGVTNVVATSPHCWDTMSRAPADERRVRHYTELLAELQTEGRLSIAAPTRRRVTFHDPCYLGRHNGVIAEPRQLIRAAGAELVEMEQHGEASLCCGGGGGRLWQELPDQGELAQRRVRQAAATGAEFVITACPLCLIMLEDARKTAGLEEKIEVKDLAELLADALG